MGTHEGKKVRGGGRQLRGSNIRARQNRSHLSSTVVYFGSRRYKTENKRDFYSACTRGPTKKRSAVPAKGNSVIGKTGLSGGGGTAKQRKICAANAELKKETLAYVLVQW